MQKPPREIDGQLLPERGPRPRAPTEADLYLGNPAHEDLLSAELLSLSRRGEAIGPGVIAVPCGPVVDPCFALQVMPRARALSAANPNDLANDVLALLPPDASPAPENVQVILPRVERQGSSVIAEHPLAAAAGQLDDLFAKKVLGRREKQAARDGAARPLTGHRVQVLLTEAWRVYVSTDVLTPAPPLLAWPAVFAAGRAVREEARDSPSSAHRKLDEAFVWLGTAPGPDDVVVDLGAAPGGWTSVALARGARVIAVDRGAMSPELVGHPRLEIRREDAFAFVPDLPPTFLFCDVIAEPSRTFALLERALTWPTLKAAVVTLKLKRPLDTQVLAMARALSKRAPRHFGRTKNLVANKCEVTAMFVARDVASAPTR